MEAGHHEPVDLSKATIEHVMPQTLNRSWREELGAQAERIHDEWLHTPGNLTLSGYNSTLGNKPFAVKKEELSQSHIRMNEEIAREEHWGEAQMQARAERLAEVAAGIWLGPAEELPAAEDELETRPQEDLASEYWDAFIAFLQSSDDRLATRVTAAGSNLFVGLGIPDVELIATARAERPRTVSVNLYLSGPDRDAVYRALQSEREQIESDYGRWLYWSRNTKGQVSSVGLVLPHAQAADRGEWPRQHQWIRDQIHNFVRAFGHRISQLAVSREEATA